MSGVDETGAHVGHGVPLHVCVCVCDGVEQGGWLAHWAHEWGWGWVRRAGGQRVVHVHNAIMGLGALCA